MSHRGLVWKKTLRGKSKKSLDRCSVPRVSYAISLDLKSFAEPKKLALSYFWNAWKKLLRSANSPYLLGIHICVNVHCVFTFSKSWRNELLGSLASPKSGHTINEIQRPASHWKGWGLWYVFLIVDKIVWSWLTSYGKRSALNNRNWQPEHVVRRTAPRSRERTEEKSRKFLPPNRALTP